MARPVIALLTDFGTRDHYAGAMKGVVLDLCPDASLVDITHDVEPQDILGGALELAAAFRYFPAGTIFLCVVDPGVGSSRKAIASDAGGYRFVAPDNGLLTLVFRDTPPTCVVELAEPRYAKPTISRTFEGRDRFAPAAGWLGKGLDVAALGPPLSTWHLLKVPEPRTVDRTLTGEVLRIDRFGNLVTNIDRRTFDRVMGRHSVVVTIGGHVVRSLISTYAEASVGALSALFGSSEHLEIAVVGGSAASQLDCARGTSVAVTRR